MARLLRKAHEVYSCILAFTLLLPSLIYSISLNECVSKSGSSDRCVCSLSRAVDSIIAIVKGSQVESQLASFQCSHFIQLPLSLTKAEEFPAVPKEIQEDGHGKSRNPQPNAENELNEEYQDENTDAEEIIEHPRYFVDTQGRRHGPRHRKRRIRREVVSQFLSPLEISNHRRSKRQAALGVPNSDTFSQVVAKMPSPKELHQYVPLGSSVTLQCFNLQNRPYFKKFSNKKFTWTYFDGRPVTTAQMAVDKKSGTLTIYAVQLQDTDLYNCTVDLINRNSEIEMTETFSHQIDVVSEPAFWLQMSTFYITDSDSCFPEEIYDIESSISPWVHAYACENCEVRNTLVTCQHDEGQTKIRIQMVITTMGIESKIPKLKFGTAYSCPLTCSEKLHLKLLEIIKASLAKMLSLPIMLIDEEGESIWYESVSSSMTTDVVEGCLSGFYLAYKLCFPCPVGKYSPNGKVECILCPKGSYQNKQGSSGCIRCPAGLSTLREGCATEFNCLIPTAFDGAISWMGSHWILVLVIFIFLSIVLKVVIFLWCFPASKVTTIIRMVLCCWGCFHDCCDCCAKCCKRPVMPKKTSKTLRRSSSLLITTDTTSPDATSESDALETMRKFPKKNLRANLTALGSRASKILPKSGKRLIKTTLSEIKTNNVVGATSKLLNVAKKARPMISEEDSDDREDGISMPLYKTKTLPEKNAANDGVIKQLKGIANVENNLRTKMRRKDAFKV